MKVSIIKPRWVVRGFHPDGSPEIQEDVAVAFSDGMICEIAPLDKINQKYANSKINYHNEHILTPGFVNSHHHLGLTPFQLGAPDLPLEIWFAARLGMRSTNIYLDTLFSAFEMLSSGVTTVQHIQGWAAGDLENVYKSSKDVLRAYSDIGMRVSYCYALREQNKFVYEDDDIFCAALPEQIGKALSLNLAEHRVELEDYIQLFEHLFNDNQSKIARVQLAPANLHWMTDKGLLTLKEVSKKFNVPMHMHLLETPFQKEYAYQRTGTSAVNHLLRLGILGPDLTLGHGVWMTEEDIEIVAETNTCVCHNCSSNFRLRSGTLPLMRLLSKNLRVGIGIDEAGINEDRDMLQEMRMALITHRTPGLAPGEVPSADQILRMATEFGASTTAFRGSIGRLDPGKRMDALLFNYRSVTHPYQETNIPLVSVLIQRAKSKDIYQVYVDGELSYSDGKFIKVDRDHILELIAEDLSKNKTSAEIRSFALATEVTPFVIDFYRDYLTHTSNRRPFYSASSRD
ncbi:MAG: amidohydrolase family protein [Paracoccaceae bacterium]